MIDVLGIDHPAVAADDVDKLSDWYCEVFNYKKVFRDRKPVWILQAPDGTLLEVMPKDGTLRQKRTTWTPGWSHLALRVKNFEGAMQYLEKLGVTWGGMPTAAIGGGRVRTLYDPEGNMLQIVERKLDDSHAYE